MLQDIFKSNFLFQYSCKILKFLIASNENRALSEIKALFKILIFFGKIRIIFESLTEINILDPVESVKSIEAVVFSSHGRPLKEYKLEVKAPTGHKSMTFPDTLEV